MTKEEYIVQAVAEARAAAEAFMRLFDDLVDCPYFFCKTGQ